MHPKTWNPRHEAIIYESGVTSCNKLIAKLSEGCCCVLVCNTPADRDTHFLSTAQLIFLADQQSSYDSSKFLTDIYISPAMLSKEQMFAV